MLDIDYTMLFNLVFHVLGGLISPMDGIGQDDLKLMNLFKK